MRRFVAFLLVGVAGLARAAQHPDLTEEQREALRQEMVELFRAEAKELQASSAVNSDLTLAYPVIDALNGFQPRRGAPLERVPMTADGWPRLLPGLWSSWDESFCLKVRTYAPADGDGYAFAPLEGPRAHIIDRILRGVWRHREIDQEDAQLLVWSVLFRTPPEALAEGAQRAAAVLLTDADRAELATAAAERQAVQERYAKRYREILEQLLGGLFDHVSPELFERFGGEVPDLGQAIAQTANDMSQLDYEQVQGLAFLPDERPTPAEGQRLLPTGCWTYHPAGIFVSAVPDGYRVCNTRYYVPEPIRIACDGAGRVTRMEDPQGWRIEVTYAGDPEPLDGDGGVTRSPFASILFVDSDPLDPRTPREYRVEGTGWLLSGVPNGQGPTEGEVGERYRQAAAAVAELTRLEPVMKTLHPRRAPVTATVHESLVDLLSFAEALRAASAEAVPEGHEEWEAMFDRVGLAYRAAMGYLAAWAEGGPPQRQGRAAPGLQFASFGVTPVVFSPIDWIYERWFKPRDPHEWQPGINIPWGPSSQCIGSSSKHAAYRQAYNDFGVAQKHMGTAGKIISKAGANPVTAAGGIWLSWIISFDFALYAKAGNDIANADPPRADYTVIADAADLHLRHGPLETAPGWSPARIRATNAMLTAVRDAGALMRAAVWSYERAGGAQAAGDKTWAGRQVQAMVHFERAAGEAGLEAAAAIEAWLALLEEEGAEDLWATEEELTEQQQRWQNEGFSAEERAAAERLGLDESEIAGCLAIYLADPIEGGAWAKPTFGELAVQLRAMGAYLASLPATPLP